MAARFSILMVCMGNICRSPTAEGVFRHLVRQAQLEELVHIDSAGTLDYHVGSPPDERSRRHAQKRGYDLSALRARQVHRLDFEQFDLILAMDWQNLEELRELCPPEHRHKAVDRQRGETSVLSAYRRFLSRLGITFGVC